MLFVKSSNAYSIMSELPVEEEDGSPPRLTAFGQLQSFPPKIFRKLKLSTPTIPIIPSPSEQLF
jgi:hypothetical protein